MLINHLTNYLGKFLSCESKNFTLTSKFILHLSEVVHKCILQICYVTPL
jgi:hypothetical protein